MNRSLLIALISSVLFVLAGCGAEQMVPTDVPTNTPAPTRTPTPEPVFCADVYYEVVEPILGRWDDAMAIADSTARINLAGPVSTLQEIRREAASLDVPECAAKAHEGLIEAMEHYIEGFLAFMADKPDSIVDVQFDLGNDKLENWGDYIQELYNSPIE